MYAIEERLDNNIRLELTHYIHDVVDHYSMVFVYRILNYRALHHFELASVHDETVLRLRPFPFVSLTFFQILQLQ